MLSRGVAVNQLYDPNCRQVVCVFLQRSRCPFIKLGDAGVQCKCNFLIGFVNDYIQMNGYSVFFLLPVSSRVKKGLRSFLGGILEIIWRRKQCNQMFFSSEDHVTVQFRSLVPLCFRPVSQGCPLLWLGSELNRMRWYLKPPPSLLFHLIFVSHQAINYLLN